jgi:DNA polymerase-4
VVLRLRFDDFTRASRSLTLPHATAQTPTILTGVRQLVREAHSTIEARGITLLGIAVANLDNDDAVQLELPFGRRDRRALDITLDEVKDRFGTTAITRAVLLGRGEGMSMPLLPD